MDRRNDELSEATAQWEDLEDQRQDLAEQQRAIIDGLKAKGYPPKEVRRVLARRKRERDEVLAEDERIQALEAQLGMRL